MIWKIKDLAANLSEEEDKCIWVANQNGKMDVGGQMISVKWYILMWRALKRKLSLDEIIQSKGIHLASNCNCCETRD